MARTRRLYMDDIKSAFRPKGTGWFIKSQQRAYVREDGKFVAFGTYVVFARYRSDLASGQQELTRVILDTQLE